MEAATGDSKAGSELEGQLGELLDQETFEPSKEFKEAALVTDESLREEAASDPDAWWLKLAGELDWFTDPTEGLDDSNPPFFKWFADGKINASHNCLDRHIEAGIGDRVAFYWHGEEGETREVTYADLHRDVQKLANVLLDRGVEAGDIVGIYLPMIPEVAVAMLACARIGAPHNVVFGGFSPDAVKERMQFSEAKALITVDQARRKGKSADIKPAVDAFLDDVPSIETVIVVRNTGADVEMNDGRDIFYDEAIAGADDECPAAELDAEHPLYILYSSGSTAKPKGILHTTGGYLTGVAWTHKYVFDLKPESDVYWCSADVGWVTGHSYIVYGPLLNGATSVMYEGAPDYPDKDIWWELCDRYDVTLFYTAPTAIRACIKWGAEYPERHDLSKLRLLGSVGEPINPKAWLWYWKVIGGGNAPDRRHLVADRDRQHHDHDASRGPGVEARVGRQATAGCRGGRGRRAGRRCRYRAGPARAQAPNPGNAAHALPRRRSLRRDLLLEIRTGDVLRRRCCPRRRRRLLLGDRARR